jgi:hypothetical protein
MPCASDVSLLDWESRLQRAPELAQRDNPSFVAQFGRPVRDVPMQSSCEKPEEARTIRVTSRSERGRSRVIPDNVLGGVRKEGQEEKAHSTNLARIR